MRNPTLADQLAPFEVFPDRELLVGRPIVARVVGRRFEQLLEAGAYDRPYDARFAKAMVKTLTHLAATLGASFGFAEFTELSLYAIANGGDARRLLSRIAGEASAKLSLLLGEVATFEARLYEFPETRLAHEYFAWRQAEAHARAVDRYSLHVLQQSGADQNAVPRILDGLGADEKIELMRQNALDFSSVPSWQRRGACVRIRSEGNGAGGAARMVVDLNLPSDAEFTEYLSQALT
jgi:tRNA(His) 5'-end guanylyltransferase